jgi:hypothetical protein
MNLPVLNGTIDRRILINYRVSPEIVRVLLPPHLEPLIINGYASAGICLLRLKNIGVKNTPHIFRITSENAAHRFLVRYKNGDRESRGVYIPRRDTDSMLNVLLAGKLFAWPHFSAKFKVDEQKENYSVEMRSADLKTTLQVSAHLTNSFPATSMFDSLDHASACFCDCSIGISPSPVPNKYKTIQLKTTSWAVRPLTITRLCSNYFEDTRLFPEGSIEFDNALLMEGIKHEWVSST